MAFECLHIWKERKKKKKRNISGAFFKILPLAYRDIDID